MSKINIADFQAQAQEMMSKMGVDLSKFFGK